MRLVALAVPFALTFAAAVPAAAQSTVEIPGNPALKAVLYRPPGAGPFAAVVALHGCSGLGSRGGPVGIRYRDWAERLTAAGFVVLFPDSFGSRGLGPQCAVKTRKVRASRERVDDARAARRWLQDQAFVKADRVSLMGWSNGAVSTLWTVRPQAAAPDGKPDFRSAVALYPGCRQLGERAWSARLPTLILIGAADDWTPADACQRMVAEARQRSALVSLVSFPGAYHGFDHPDMKLRVRTGMAFSADGSGRVHLGTDPAARAEAIRRVPEWLKR